MSVLSKQIQDAINDQIKAEMDSAYTYLSMAAYLESVSLPGFGRWMRVQYEEEVAHALRLFDYVHERGGRVTLDAIGRPPSGFKSVLDVFQETLKHERKVTALINKLYEMAGKESDFATQVELQWFVKEQVEEEKSVTVILDQLKMVGTQGVPLLMMDRQLAQRGSK
jgi:ferritin